MKPGTATFAGENRDSPVSDFSPALRAIPPKRARLRRFAEADAGFIAQWDSLSSEAAEPNPFLESWYCLPGHDLFDRYDDSRLLTVEGRDGELLGLFPVTIAETYGRIPVRHVQNWSHQNVFLGTPLVRRGAEKDFWRKALSCLDEADWAEAFLHLEGLTEGGPVHRALEATAQAMDRDCDVVLRNERPLVSTSLRSEDYIEQNLSSKRRGEYRRKRRRLCELGELAVSELSDPADLGPWCEQFLELEARGWKGEACSALASQPATRQLFETVLRGAFERGRLHFTRLDLDGRPIAMQTSLIAQPGAFGFKACYDETLAKFSVGMLLQLDALSLIDRPDIDWQDSCSASDHPVGAIWSERRPIVRVTVPLAGLKRKLTHFVARTAERGAKVARTVKAGGVVSE